MHTEQNQVAFGSWTEDAISKHSLLNSFIACSLMCTLQIRFHYLLALFVFNVQTFFLYLLVYLNQWCKRRQKPEFLGSKMFESWIGSSDYSFRKYLLRLGELLPL